MTALPRHLRVSLAIEDLHKVSIETERFIIITSRALALPRLILLMWRDQALLKMSPMFQDILHTENTKS